MNVIQFDETFMFKRPLFGGSLSEASLFVPIFLTFSVCGLIAQTWISEDSDGGSISFLLSQILDDFTFTPIDIKMLLYFSVCY